jgi:hypothetical protein
MGPESLLPCLQDPTTDPIISQFISVCTLQPYFPKIQ